MGLFNSLCRAMFGIPTRLSDETAEHFGKWLGRVLFRLSWTYTTNIN